MNFGRLVTAMATPFTADGSLDTNAVATLVDHLIDHGTTAVVVCGTTGESPTLSHDEKLQLLNSTLDAVQGRIPVLAGTGCNDTAESVRLSLEAQAAGADALLLVAPYYNRPSQEGLYQHFKAVSEAVSLPIMLYNIPGRSAVNIEVSTLLRLAELSNVVAVKEASGDFSHVAQLAALKADDFLLYSGDDKFTLPILALGGVGVVSVASHLVGPEMRSMIDAFFAGDVAAAATWNGRLLPMFEALFRVSSPSPLKAALQLMGLPAGSVRLPLVDAPQSVIDELKQQLARLNKLPREVAQP